MVKSLDEKDGGAPIDHVGWSLFRASEHWQNAFRREMVKSGHPWFAEARANVLPHLDRAGTRQSVLTARMEMSKQAVQQFVDGLVADGVVERSADPDDARGKIVRFTREGLAVLTVANRVKRRIEADFESRLGKAKFQQLCLALAELNASFGEPRDE